MVYLICYLAGSKAQPLSLVSSAQFRITVGKASWSQVDRFHRIVCEFFVEFENFWAFLTF
jgi:hypothetical protein